MKQKDEEVGLRRETEEHKNKESRPSRKVRSLIGQGDKRQTKEQEGRSSL